MHIINAEITHTELGHIVNGLFSCWLSLDYGGAGQSFGRSEMDSYNKVTKQREGMGYELEFIKAILETVGVTRWEDLVGQHIRVAFENERNHKILGIGHLIKDDWFYPEKDLARFVE